METQSKKILIIEDDENLTHLLKEALKKEGFVVLTAADGKKGLLTALEEEPALILLDIVLPQLDGLTMLQQLRANKKGADIPVIILSNLSDAEEVSRAMESGAYDFLVKADWNISDVVDKVKKRVARE